MPIPDPAGFDLKYAIGLPPEKALEYFRAKTGLQITKRWQDLWEEAHTRAFTVAGIAREDVLADVRDSLIKAIEQGQTFAQWRDAIDKTLTGRGWIGRAGVDKDGVIVEGRIAPYRLDTIYRTNMQVAFEAGQRSKFMGAEHVEYLMYSAVMDRRTRPAHAALNGQVFRKTDPFWATHYPPNGYRCRCRAIYVDAQEIGAGPGQHALSSGAGKIGYAEVPVKKGSDETRRVARYEIAPGKFVTTDPGWSHAPGADMGELNGILTQKQSANALWLSGGKP